MRHAALTLLPTLLVTLVAACEDPRPAAVEPPATRTAGEVAFELRGPGGAALVVPVEVNGEGPFDFVLDTGATLMCLDQRLADQLNLRQDARRTGVAAGVEGTGRLQLVRLDSVRLGGALAQRLSACVLDLEHTQALGIAFDGLVGLNFLREFRVTLDFERNVLHLE
jgi:predicted aspartyl protease